MKYNFHTHSTYCDGKDTPEEMVLEAIKLGITDLGFSGHSYTFFDESYCMSKANVKEYIKCINDLKAKYEDKINIYLGIEQDYYSEYSTSDFEYIIGAVHYVKKNDAYIEVDGSLTDLKANIDKYYGGDVYSFLEDYYGILADVPAKTNCNILAHFDLVTKFNKNKELFDPENERYISAVNKAIDKLSEYDIYFEINTGAMARGYTDYPYPSDYIINKLIGNNKRLIFSSDCHDKNYLLYGFEEINKKYPIVKFEFNKG